MIKFHVLAILAVSTIGVRSAVATPFDPLRMTPARSNAFFLGAAPTPYAARIQGSVAVPAYIFLASRPLELSGAAQAPQNDQAMQDDVTVSGFLGANGASVLSAALYDADGLSGDVVLDVHDASYWGRTQTGNGPPSLSPPLDVFGSQTDVDNAVTSLENLATANMASIANGVLTLNVTKNGINTVKAAIPNGVVVTGIDVVAANGVWPTGLVLAIAGDTLAYEVGAFALKPLNSRQTLIRFDNGAAISLSAISLRNLPPPPLTSIDFTRGRLPIAYSIMTK